MGGETWLGRGLADVPWCVAVCGVVLHGDVFGGKIARRTICCVIAWWHWQSCCVVVWVRCYMGYAM